LVLTPPESRTAFALKSRPPRISFISLLKAANSPKPKTVCSSSDGLSISQICFHDARSSEVSQSLRTVAHLVEAPTCQIANPSKPTQWSSP
jgi:hypothetical protein